MKKMWQPCPPPAGMVTGAADAHAEEEECLFFVGLSRARDVLCLSRARRYGKQNSAPGDLILSLAHVLPHPPDGDVTWPSSASIAEACTSADPPLHPVPFKERHLSVYMRCPRQYYYEFELGLGGKREDSAYVQFHQCVYRVLRWLRSQPSAVSVSDAVSQLDAEWSTRGPRDHPYAEVYYASARNMVERWAGRPTRSRSRPSDTYWQVQLAHGRVSFLPDNLDDLEDGSVLIERLRTGRPTKSELDDEIYALYAAGAENALGPSVSSTIQVRYLATDRVEEVTLKPRTINTRLAKYDRAVVGILNQDFSPEPSDRTCPRCPHYFICPVG